MQATASPLLDTVVDHLTKKRLGELGVALGIPLPDGTKAVQASVLSSLVRSLQAVLRQLRPDELRALCHAQGIEPKGRALSELIAGLLSAAQALPSQAPPERRGMERRTLPIAGDLVRVRHREYLVESVTPPPSPEELTWVELACLDDDAQGRKLGVCWELELGARILSPERVGLGHPDHLDPPRHFAAYLHALEWSCVTATDAKLFQSPFRAGILLKQHQLTPLKKALELPRVNLFIADDVGLGKTIEAGLVIQELLLRQRVEMMLVVCPAAVALQWREEMESRFGLRFEIFNRAFVARRRQERGFGVNPWRTHPRFIVTYQTLRRPEYRDPLLAHLGERRRKSLLVLDEAHVAAPASAARYATDSDTTRVIRDVAPRFENRLFLSATPHNGHSNSFSWLLEILDPQRFTRGTPVRPKQLAPVMVRRLKQDLREILTHETFPVRHVERIALEHSEAGWSWRVGSSPPERISGPWIRRNQCEAVAGGKGSPRWSDRRVILFTEYGDTKRYVLHQLQAALDGTDRGDERVLQLHGGMGDARREEIQHAFNAPPSEHSVRILVATDAAREGINLQAHCADLFHLDVPWNPSRMEQRNGRIDRTLQPSKEVWCRYFVYPQRPEDRVLETLTDKVEVIQRELGSLSTVLVGRMAQALEAGIDEASLEKLERAARTEHREVVERELETRRRDRAHLASEIEEAARILDDSRKITSFEPERLRDAIDVGLELSGGGPLRPDGNGIFRLPELPESWQRTLDRLRPPRARDEPFWEWRKRSPLPVVFDPPDQMESGKVQLHLSHPLVQRILQRFLAQGFSAHDLSRVTVLQSKRDAAVRVIAFGRLTLFGPGAIRLHDELISVAARWLEGGGKGHLKPFAEEADREAIRQLEETLRDSPSLEGIPEALRARLLASAAGDFETLWRHVETEADGRAHEAERKLTLRGASEARALGEILEEQRTAIEEELKGRQLELEFESWERSQKEQWLGDQQHMQRRLAEIDREIATEPSQLEESYRVLKSRLSPVGLVYLWPHSR